MGRKFASQEKNSAGEMGRETAPAGEEPDWWMGGAKPEAGGIGPRGQHGLTVLPLLELILFHEHSSCISHYFLRLTGILDR